VGTGKYRLEVCTGRNLTARPGQIRFRPGPFSLSNFWPGPLRTGPEPTRPGGHYALTKLRRGSMLK